MKCVIIAAGQGTRLRARAESKPLAQVAGRPLIDHVVLAAAAGGAGDFLVVTGYRPEPIEDHLAGLAARTGLSIATVRNPDWARPNGLSVLAAAPHVEGEFMLLMADHLFEPRILGRLAAERVAGAALTLAADFRLGNPDVDLDDVTKVAVAPDGRIRRIGKTLADYDAFDTGLFLATPALPEAIDRSLRDGGSGSLSDGVQALAEAGRAFVLDSGDSWWIDVDDEAALRRAEAALAAASALRDI
jgi:1L-myo-inositol 1-phosphate cytidylyltransferase